MKKRFSAKKCNWKTFSTSILLPQRKKLNSFLHQLSLSSFCYFVLKLFVQEKPTFINLTVFVKRVKSKNNLCRSASMILTYSQTIYVFRIFLNIFFFKEFLLLLLSVSVITDMQQKCSCPHPFLVIAVIGKFGTNFLVNFTFPI